MADDVKPYTREDIDAFSVDVQLALIGDDDPDALSTKKEQALAALRAIADTARAGLADSELVASARRPVTNDEVSRAYGILNRVVKGQAPERRVRNALEDLLDQRLPIDKGAQPNTLRNNDPNG